MNTLITTHAHVDFDALASVVAAQKIYPRAVILLPHQVNNNIRSFLNLYRDYLPLIEPDFLADYYRLLVVVDTRRRSRLYNKIAGFLDRGIDLHIYDHHPDQKEDLIGSRMVVEPVGATTTLLVEEIKSREIPLTELEASIMAMGIYEDTGYLTFSSTTPRDVEALSFLWKQPINLDVIQEFLQRPLTAGQKTLLEKLILQTEFMTINQRKILFSWASAEGYIQGIAELIHRLSSLEEAEAAFSFVKMEGKIHVVARSFHEDINLLDILSFWKARGHPSATSLTLKYDSIFRARQELMELLKLNLPLPLTAKDIASVPIKTVDIGTPVSEALQLLEKYGHSGFVVLDEGNLAGVVSRKDLHKALRHKLTHAPVKAFMSKKVITAAHDESINDLRRLMIDNNIGRIPILDAKGNLYGMVTRSDILRSFYHMDAVRVDARNQIPYTEKYLEIAADEDNLEKLDDLTLYINRELPPELQKLLLFISQRAEKEEVSIYLVGGSIRDMLLGSFQPADLDIVVIPEAIPFARSINSFLKGHLQIYEPFGTASITMKDGVRLDLVTARKEFYQTPAALPQVEASGLKNDLFRRDFTINTLACSLNADSFGKLYDFFGGLKDLQAGIIRVLYHLSFVDDPLRILRAVRFEKRFDFEIEEKTRSFIENAVEKRILMRVSRTRLNAEVRLIFHEDDPPAILKRLEEFELLSFIFPRLKPDPQKWKLLAEVRETMRWVKTRRWEREPDPEIIYLSALYHHLPTETIRFMGYRMHFSREKIETMVLASTIPEIIEKLSHEEPGPGKVFNILDPLPQEILLLLRTVAPHPRIRDYPQFYWDHLHKVTPHLRGKDLKEMGVRPGPIYGRILKDLREAVIDGRVRSVEEERNFVLSYLDQNPDGSR